MTASGAAFTGCALLFWADVRLRDVGFPGKDGSNLFLNVMLPWLAFAGMLGFTAYRMLRGTPGRALLVYGESALSRRGIRIRTARGQIDPLWLIIGVGIALVLAFAVWKFIIPNVESGVSSGGSGVSNINSGVTSCETNPSATCTVAPSSGGN